MFAYNKPDTTRQVFQQIKLVQPTKLYIVLDGPKTEEEKVFTEATKDIFDEIDWNCEVKKLYSVGNLGLKKRFKSALDEIFKNEESLIILEDDTLPTGSFFRYCDLLLEKFKNNNEIIQINGHNYLSKTDTDDSYYMTTFSEIWGWATWSDRWFENYNDNFRENWNKIKKTDNFKNKFLSHDEYEYFYNIFDNAHKNIIDSWEFPWLFSMRMNELLAVSPNKNLVKNLGFGHPGATHTHQKLKYLSITRNKNYELNFPLQHPKKINKVNNLIEKEFNKRLLKNSKLSKVIYLLKKLTNPLLKLK